MCGKCSIHTFCSFVEMIFLFSVVTIKKQCDVIFLYYARFFLLFSYLCPHKIFNYDFTYFFLFLIDNFVEFCKFALATKSTLFFFSL